MGRLDGKVAFITGAARGQGRSHAVRLAQEGCEIIGLDLCAQIESVGYPMATAEDLSETVRLVEEHDHRMVAVQADVRDLAQVEAVLQRGLREFGRLDIVPANAGIAPIVGEQRFQALFRRGALCHRRHTARRRGEMQRLGVTEWRPAIGWRRPRTCSRRGVGP
ncbi:MAG: SDR family NAD(P)-dependent oxidoreductase [Chloroflexi bacterium]|nr:MAG: SDR family NAD(P)-dependent oxidoreductase [Chloroflexota bacterium]